MTRLVFQAKTLSIAVILVLLFLSNCGKGPMQPNQNTVIQPSESLSDLEDIDELGKLFNQDCGVPRLILLISPVCPVCVNGAGWVQREILERYPSASLRVYAIWFSMYPGDSRSRWTASILSDPRVKHFWDEERLAGRLFANIASHREVEWDAYFLYSPDGRWDKMPSPLISCGRPIMRNRKILGADILPLLKAAGSGTKSE